jgi:hypothetical protein
MYGISAVQMSHDDWFKVRPIVTEQTLALTAARDDARAIAREVMERLPSARGEAAKASRRHRPASICVSTFPARCTRSHATSERRVHVRLSATGVMGMLNRLHPRRGTRAA